MKVSKIVSEVLICFGFFALISTLVMRSAVANPPSSVVLTYDLNTQTLNVTVSHPGFTQSHYIATVEIRKNNAPETTGSYTSQPSETFTYSFSVVAIVGDNLAAKAICSIFGDNSGTITVQNSSQSNPNPDNPSPDTPNPTGIPGFPTFQLLFWAFIIVVGSIHVRRKSILC